MASLSVVCLGASRVGKSQMLNWYRKKRALKEYTEEPESVCEFVWNVGDEDVDIEFYDTGGSSDYQCFLEKWLTTGKAFIFVFNLSDGKSLEYIEDAVGKLKGKGVGGVVVGNKLRNQVVDEASRVRGQSLAAAFNRGQGCPYLEICTSDGSNVRSVFDHVILQLSKKDLAGDATAGAQDGTRDVVEDIHGDVAQDVPSSPSESSWMEEIAVLRAGRLEDRQKMAALEAQVADLTRLVQSLMAKVK